MLRQFANVAAIAAMTTSQLVGVSAMAQVPVAPTGPMPVQPGGPTPVQPTRPWPQVQPPRPTPQPVRPNPQIQPPRPTPQPIRPPRPIPQPVRPLPGPGYPGNGNGNWNGGGNGGNWNNATIRCESQNYRYRECRADTSGGVRLVRVRGGNCVQGGSWGYRANFIWVNNGCRADFQTRYGGNNGGSYDNGPSTGAIIGGVAVAAGLIALLAATNKKSAPVPSGNPAQPLPSYVPPAGSSGAPARITADTGGVTPSARPSLNTCLSEAAKQIGATGGTEIRLDRLDNIEAGNGGYRFRFQLIAVYPDETRTIPTFCRATPTTLVELTFG